MKQKQYGLLLVGLLTLTSSMLFGNTHEWRDTIECKNADYLVSFSAKYEIATVRGPKDSKVVFLKCSISEGSSLSYYCYEHGVADAGYSTYFTPMSGIPYSVKLSEITFVGEKTLAQLSCF